MQLKKKNIEYTEVVGEEPIRNLGFKGAPVLVVDGVAYAGAKAIFDYLKGV